MSNQYNEALVEDIHRATQSETLDISKNAALYERVAAGDAAAREAMIVGNMPLVLSKVEALIQCLPTLEYLRDDLVSAGCIGLTNAVNKMARGKGPRSKEISGSTDFIGMWINRELKALIEVEVFIKVPHSSKARASAEGVELTVPTVCNVIPERFQSPSCRGELETREILDACCDGADERTLLAMREAGYTFQEIADAIGRPLSSTHVLEQRLKGRIQRKLKVSR